MKKRVGIMGGTFNPIHNGHLLIAEQAKEQMNLDEIWFMPARIPPHKQDTEIISVEHRVNMVNLAIADHPQFFLSTIELDREGPSYTVDTLEEARVTFPDFSFFFIAGGDMLTTLPKWHRFNDLVQLVQFIGFDRPGSSFERMDSKANITYLTLPKWEISSTGIREMARQHRSLRYLVPSSVESYIKEHKLYE